MVQRAWSHCRVTDLGADSVPTTDFVQNGAAGVSSHTPSMEKLVLLNKQHPRSVRRYCTTLYTGYGYKSEKYLQRQERNTKADAC